MQSLHDWFTQAIQIADADLAELDNRGSSADIERIRDLTDLPPCPVCGAEVNNFRHLRLDYGAMFKPCGCQLGLESWQTRLTRRGASAGVFLLVLASALGLFVGPRASDLVEVSTMSAVMLISVGIIAIFIPRREYGRDEVRTGEHQQQGRPRG